VSRWGRQYCIGYCHLRQDLRTFRLDRIFDLEFLDRTFAEPTEFDLQAYLSTDPFFQLAVQVVLRFESAAALVALNNRAYWETCEEQPDGGTIVTFTAPDLDAATDMVLSVGFPATIVEPAALRERVRMQARVLADHFAVEGTG
jgi:predicted DNA-binding transcriptional regulator YafY